ncbi:MAG TPA: TcmI family type II polyketide cyclase [Ktedonobacteraceae bacterium]|nr:TcmI family type II polyketide cyclase [Ktedonobacteraceae bacterium]
MERFALFFKVKPGTEEEVARIFQSYGRPNVEVSTKTRLLGTSVFMKDNVVVRILDIEGDLEEAATFLSQQGAIQQVEKQLNQYLEEPRDFADPNVARKFFETASMRRLTHREAGRPIQ